jgi:iron complex transport system substrate-binding protein
LSPRPRLGALVALTLSTVLLAAGCATSTGSAAQSAIAPTAAPSAAASPSVAPSPPATAAPSAAVATFPITLTDDENGSATLAAAPQRIVSLTPATTEILFALGVGDRVVATDDTSTFPAAAEPLPDVATYGKVDVEQIVGLDADLVIAGGLGFNPPEAVAQLRDLKIPVLVVYAPSIDGVYHDIDLIGQATGSTPAAAELTGTMRQQMTAINDAVKAAGTAPRVYYEVGYDDTTGQIFAPAKDSFVAEMVTMAGGDVITTADASSYEIPLEDLVAADPQLIVLGVNAFYSPTPEQVKARAGWKVMSALKDDAVVVVQDTEITRPGPRLPTGLRNLAAAIHPDASLPPAP